MKKPVVITKPSKLNLQPTTIRVLYVDALRLVQGGNGNERTTMCTKVC
jgi:hypothetical protein